MKRLALIAILLAPGAAMADKASTCVTVIRALDQAQDALDNLDRGQSDAYDDLIVLRDRIGGYGGALVELRAGQHVEAYVANRRAVTQEVRNAMQAIMDYCS